MYSSNHYPPKQVKVEKKPAVFDHLYENKKKPLFYKKPNDTPSEQRVVEEHCTFRPVINEECPFISERTLRNFANRQRRKPPPPPSRGDGTSRSPLRRKARDARLSGNVVEEPLSGIYTKAGGFKRGPPPHPNMPIYYFDPIAPPSFESGKFHTGEQSASAQPATTEVYEDVEVTDDEAEGAKNSGLQAPPLPDWAFTPGGPSSAAAAVVKKALVIPTRKGPKAEAEAPAATGWNAVLLEMQRKKEQIMNKEGLKKAEPVKKEAAPAPVKKKGKKKGSKDFKDVMDELNYKLAKLRGEIVEEEDSDDSEEPPAPAAKAGKKAAASVSATTTPENTNANSPVPDESTAGVPPLTPKPGKKAGISFADPADGEEGDSPAVPPTRKLPSKESMMNLLSKVTKAPAPVVEESAMSRAKSAPDLMAMLAKRTAPPPGAGDAAPTPATPSAAGGGQKAATAKPESVPAPPPIPKAWPPVPHTAVEPEGASVKKGEKKKKVVRKLVSKTDAAGGGKAVLTEQTAELPEGYYMAAPVIGMVRPRHVLPGGTTSAELCASLKLTFAQAAEAAEMIAMGGSPVPQTPYVKYDLSLALSPQGGADEYKSEHYDSSDEVARDWNELSPHQHIKDRLAISDLPLPSDFHVAVQRLQQSSKKREAIVEQERDLELRSFLYYEKSDKGADNTPPGSGKKPELTVPVEFVSHVQNHLEKKQYSHRKQAPQRSADEDLPLNARISSAYKCPSTVYPRSTSSDVVTAFWLNNLRPTVNTPTSAAPTGPGTPSGSRPATARAHGASPHVPAHIVSPSLVPPAYRQKTPQGKGPVQAFGGVGSPAPMTPHHAFAQSLISPIAHASFDASSDLSSVDEQQMTPGAKYFMNFRPQTQPKAPKMRSEELVSRRQSARKEREEREAQQQREEAEAARQRKLAMKARAMQAAQEAGAYKASTRYHQHQRIFERYSGHPDVGHNIEQAAKVAYAQYTTSHHLPDAQGDSLYANTAAQQAQRRAAAQASKLHQLELEQIQSLEQEYREYDDSPHRYNFSASKQRNMLPY